MSAYDKQSVLFRKSFNHQMQRATVRDEYDQINHKALGEIFYN